MINYTKESILKNATLIENDYDMPAISHEVSSILLRLDYMNVWGSEWGDARLGMAFDDIATWWEEIQDICREVGCRDNPALQNTIGDIVQGLSHMIYGIAVQFFGGSPSRLPLWFPASLKDAYFAQRALFSLE